jgi:hypothetical protein
MPFTLHVEKRAMQRDSVLRRGNDLDLELRRHVAVQFTGTE